MMRTIQIKLSRFIHSFLINKDKINLKKKKRISLFFVKNEKTGSGSNVLEMSKNL